jgi:serine O-acetyltransferase
LPDPVLRTLSQVLDQHSLLEERVDELERVLSRVPSTEPLVRELSLSPPDEASIREALRQVIDPEIGINVVDLGLIRDIALNGRGVEVHMMTCAECSMMGYLVEQVQRRVRGVVDQEPVEVVLLDETWNWNFAAAYFMEGGGI